MILECYVIVKLDTMTFAAMTCYRGNLVLLIAQYLHI